jgi:hypothetical protein
VAARLTSVASKLTGGRAGFLAAPVVSIVSQAIGLIQIVLLTRAGGAGVATDAYFFLFNIALLPIQVLLVGVYYPMLLNGGDGRSRLALGLRQGVPVLSVVCVGGGSLWLNHTGKLPTELLPLVWLLAANGLLSAYLWFRCLTLAAEGHAAWLAGVALPANAIAAALIVVPWDNPIHRAEIMVGGLVVGNFALLSHMRTRHIGEPVTVRVSGDPGGNVRGGAGWFFAKSTTGYASGNVIQGLAALLPATGVTVISIMTRVVGSISATGVNAVIPRVIHRNSDDFDGAVGFMRLVAVIVGLPFLLGFAVCAAWSFDGREYVVVALAWLFAAAMNAIAQRMTYRFLDPSASVMSIASAFLIVGGLCAVSGSDWFGLQVLLGGSVALEAVPAVCLAVTLAQFRVALATAVVLGLSIFGQVVFA